MVEQDAFLERGQSGLNLTEGQGAGIGVVAHPAEAAVGHIQAGNK